MSEIRAGGFARHRGPEFSGYAKYRGISAGLVYRVLCCDNIVRVVDDFGFENGDLFTAFEGVDDDPAAVEEGALREGKIRAMSPWAKIWGDVDEAVVRLAKAVAKESAELEEAERKERARRDILNSAPGDDSRWDEI